MPERRVGKVEHYYPKVSAAAVRLSESVKLGDKVHIVGHGDDFEEKVTSLQLDHQPIEEGKPGQSIGLWVKDRVHEGDDVMLVTGGKAKAKPAKRKASKPRKAAKAAKSSKKSSPRRKSAKSRKAKASKRPMRKSSKMARKSSKKKR